MKVSMFFPRKGYVVTSKEVSRAVSAGGIEVTENSDDFLVWGSVVTSASIDLDVTVGQCVVFHALEAQSFRDGGSEYLLIHEDKILGTYVPSAEEIGAMPLSSGA